MRHMVGALLPDELHQRRTKGVLTEAFWNGPAREFGSSWSGAGVDSTIVDIHALGQMWRSTSELPDARTLGLLQSAWLSGSNRNGLAPR